MEHWIILLDDQHLITNNSENYDEKYMKIKFKSDDDTFKEDARKLWHGNSY